MALDPIYPKPRTTRPHPDHKAYPYLPKGMTIACPNQVWRAVITHILMRVGFMYLVAVMDWHSRKVLSWRVSNTLDKDNPAGLRPTPPSHNIWAYPAKVKEIVNLH